MSSVFVPGHITGFFNIENNEIALKKGSCGAGFLLDKGVKTTISDCDKLDIKVNRGSDIVINEVLKIFDLEPNFKITQDIQLPIGAGFGTSAASALSLSLAINDYLDLGYSQELCGQVAHKAEINLGSGLGDVIAQTGRGIVFRTKAGAPGIGEIESFESDFAIATKTFGEIDTSSVIQDSHYKQVISEIGSQFIDLFAQEASVSNFLTFSYEFSKKTDLMTKEVASLVDHLNSCDGILGSSMAMLGNTVFAFASGESAFKKLDIDDLNIYKLNNIGIVYD